MKKFAIAFFVGLSLMGVMVFSLYDSGSRDISFIVAMSIAGVIVIAIADPKRFSAPDGARRDYERDSLYEKRTGYLDMLERQKSNSKKSEPQSDNPDDIL